MSAYYNEIDPYAAAWLRNLITAGHLPAGDVDERSIVDVRGDDLRGYGAVHLFAGIGGWPLALRLAGLPDEFAVWTGSCPCQPFSVAGSGKGTADERHLWPAFRRLLEERRPAIVFGEQVASADGRLWLAGVRADLEALGYAVGAADLCAASVGAPHIRQRLYWVADADGDRQRPGSGRVRERQERDDAGRCCEAGGLGIPNGWLESQERAGDEPGGQQQAGWRPAFVSGAGADGGTRRLGDADEAGRGERCGTVPMGPPFVAAQCAGGIDFWADSILIPCGDGKARRIKPGLLPLASGIPNRVGQLRAAGNAIVPQVAAEFVKAAWR